MKIKVMLLDTNFSAKPIYDYLVQTGTEVYVVGGNPNDVLAKSVNNYINLDYSNIQAAGTKSIVSRDCTHKHGRANIPMFYLL